MIKKGTTRNKRTKQWLKNCKKAVSLLLVILTCGCTVEEVKKDYVTATIDAVYYGEVQDYCDLTGISFGTAIQEHEEFEKHLTQYMLYRNQISVTECSIETYEGFLNLARQIIQRIQMNTTGITEEENGTVTFYIQIMPLDFFEKTREVPEPLIKLYLSEQDTSGEEWMDAEKEYEKAVLFELLKYAECGYLSPVTIELKAIQKGDSFALSEEDWNLLDRTVLGIKTESEK